MFCQPLTMVATMVVWLYGSSDVKSLAFRTARVLAVISVCAYVCSLFFGELHAQGVYTGPVPEAWPVFVTN
jgi:hypothetical protein